MPELGLTIINIYEDTIVEQHFTDGSTVLMRKDQYDAIVLEAARQATLVKSVLNG